MFRKCVCSPCNFFLQTPMAVNDINSTTVGVKHNTFCSNHISQKWISVIVCLSLLCLLLILQRIEVGLTEEQMRHSKRPVGHLHPAHNKREVREFIPATQPLTRGVVFPVGFETVINSDLGSNVDEEITIQMEPLMEVKSVPERMGHPGTAMECRHDLSDNQSMRYRQHFTSTRKKGTFWFAVVTVPLCLSVCVSVCMNVCVLYCKACKHDI